MTDEGIEPAKLLLENIYRSHHEKGKRYGYLYCHGERGPYLSEWIGKGKTVLDLGCRDGELTKFFLNDNEVIGVDIDRKALEIIREKYSVKTLWLDLNTEFPFEKESFDVVVACEIVEHIYHPGPFLEKVSSVLKPGGLFSWVLSRMISGLETGLSSCPAGSLAQIRPMFVCFHTIN